MLIERNQVKKAKVMYGVDLYGEAIDGAIENSNWADTDIYFITKDFFDFTHKYLFDELFTNMPTATGRTTEGELALLYDRFFEKVPHLLQDESVLILYTRNKALMERSLRQRDSYTILKTEMLSKKEGAYLYILQFKK